MMPISNHMCIYIYIKLLRNYASFAYGWRITMSLKMSTHDRWLTPARVKEPMVMGLGMQHLVVAHRVRRVLGKILQNQSLNLKIQRRSDPRLKINLQGQYSDIASVFSFGRSILFFISKTNRFCINGHGPYWKLLLPKAIVKVNANLLEISQWHFKLQSAGVCLSWIKMYMSENSFISESEMIFNHNTTSVVLILQYWMFLWDLLPHQLVNNLPTNSIPHENRVHLLIACFD